MARHLGIVACSAEGAALCYRTICQLGNDQMGPHAHPRITMDSVPLNRWMPAFDAGDLDELAQVMLESARVLAAAGADLLLCPDNSAHIAWDEVQASTPRPWLHIAEVVAAEAARLGYRNVAVLGTRFTMDGPVYRDALSAVGIGMTTPDGHEREVIDGVIFDELVQGIVAPASRDAYLAIIARLRRHGCDAVALACTEIPLLITPDESPLPTLDSTRLLARAALRAALD
jgi:aspartate racemase